MKNLILENWGMQDIPEELQEILEDRFLENREYWTQFQSSWYPENREKTLERFASLEMDDNIVCQTVFNGFMQLEIMALLLMKPEISEKLNIYICINSLQQQLEEYFKQRESDITPNTDEYNDSPEKREEFKQNMNSVIKGVLVKHNIFHIGYFGETEQIYISQFN